MEYNLVIPQQASLVTRREISKDTVYVLFNMVMAVCREYWGSDHVQLRVLDPALSSLRVNEKSTSLYVCCNEM